jgi:hypothetical protein
VLGWCVPDKLVTEKKLNIVEGTIRAIYNGEQLHTGQVRRSEVLRTGWPCGVAVAVLKRVDGNGNVAAKVERFCAAPNARSPALPFVVARCSLRSSVDRQAVLGGRVC